VPGDFRRPGSTRVVLPGSERGSRRPPDLLSADGGDPGDPRKDGTMVSRSASARSAGGVSAWHSDTDMNAALWQTGRIWRVCRPDRGGSAWFTPARRYLLSSNNTPAAAHSMMWLPSRSGQSAPRPGKSRWWLLQVSRRMAQQRCCPQAASAPSSPNVRAGSPMPAGATSSAEPGRGLVSTLRTQGRWGPPPAGSPSSHHGHCGLGSPAAVLRRENLSGAST